MEGIICAKHGDAPSASKTSTVDANAFIFGLPAEKEEAANF
jgi:hypothetical protein